MADYKKDRVVSIRMGQELLEAVRRRTRETGRSVSGEIAFLVREQVEACPAVHPKPRPITGWLTDLLVPVTHDEFKSARSEASAQLSKAIARKAKRQ